MKDNKLEEKLDEIFIRIANKGHWIRKNNIPYESLEAEFQIAKQFIKDNYISKEEVEKLKKEFELDEADLVSKRLILDVLNQLTKK